MNLTVKKISYVYEGSIVPALDKVSATFNRGWTGIVGDNGSGKSTLLSIVCGMNRPDSGQKVPDIHAVYCAQSTENPPHNIDDFAYDYSQEALRLRSILQIEDEWLWRFETLSHGERKKIQVACALVFEPDLVAFDEPTNHLDTQTKEALMEALQSYRGIGVIVSHDRAFLDALVYQCIFMRAGKAKVIPGSYSEAKKQSELEYNTQVSKRKAAREVFAHIQEESHRRQAEASRANARRSGKNLSKHDSDGREKLRLAVYSGQDGQSGLLSAQMNKRLKEAKEHLDSVRVEKRYDKPLELITQKAPRKVLFKKEAGTLALGKEKNLIYPDLYIGNTDRIGLRGDNGTGKSTFLQIIMDQLLPDKKIIFIPQEVSTSDRRTFLARVKNLAQEELGRLLAIVARLNSPPERILSGNELSPGELRKLMLAEGLLRAPQLIVLDEPTNHLDIHSIESLQEILDTSECALILVSHDTLFLEQLCNITWAFTKRSTEIFNGSNETQKTKNALNQDVEVRVIFHSS